MSVAIVATLPLLEGSDARRRAERTFASVPDRFRAICLFSPDIRPLGLECETRQISDSRETFERIQSIKRGLNDIAAAYCLDFEAAASILLSNWQGNVILGADQLPSLAYQDSQTRQSMDLAKLGALIEREELTIRRCCGLVSWNLSSRQLYYNRGAKDETIFDIAPQAPLPAQKLSSQDLNHYVYEHEREADAIILYEALQRLQFPWRLTVLAEAPSACRFWARDSRVTIASPHTDAWRESLRAARVAISGGSSSQHAASGLSVPRLPLWAPHFGVSILGTEHAAWRACLGGWGLVAPDRPDLLAEELTSLQLNPALRSQQHDELRRRLNRIDDKQSDQQLATLWAQCHSS